MLVQFNASLRKLNLLKNAAEKKFKPECFGKDKTHLYISYVVSRGRNEREGRNTWAESCHPIQWGKCPMRPSEGKRRSPGTRLDRKCMSGPRAPHLHPQRGVETDGRLAEAVANTTRASEEPMRGSHATRWGCEAELRTRTSSMLTFPLTVKNTLPLPLPVKCRSPSSLMDVNNVKNLNISFFFGRN